MKYITHDNGGPKFLVEVNKTTIDIYTIDETNENIEYSYDLVRLNPRKYFDKLVLHIPKYDKVYKTEKPEWMNLPEFKNWHSFDPMNSVLIRLNNHNQYMYIGHKVESFKTADRILRYFSPIGRNDVPYPYAVGETNSYLMIEGVYFNNNDIFPVFTERFIQLIDPYRKLYNTDKKTEKYYMETNKFKLKTFVD